jgi:hypothetical protein
MKPPIQIAASKSSQDEDHFFIEIVDDEDIKSGRGPKTKKKTKKKRKKKEDLKAYVRSEDCWLEERNDTVDMTPRKKESKSGKRIFDSLSGESIDTTADIPRLSTSRTELEVADPTKDMEARTVENEEKSN